VKDLYIGVPAVFGKNGAEKIIEVQLNKEEKEMFNNSVAAVKNLINSL
jgi:malate dehydrogenase